MEASERRLLAREASNLGVDLSEEQLSSLGAYVDVLRTWNRRVRLLGDRDPGTLIRKHIPDCLALSSVLPKQGPVADVGTGAGLPGLVLACIRPDLEFWLIESRARRVSFLHDAVAHIGLSNVRILGERAEDLARNAEFAARAALVTARAVAVEDLIMHGLPLLAPGGRMALMQSQRGAVKDMVPAGCAHAVKISSVREYRLSTGEARRIVVVERA